MWFGCEGEEKWEVAKGTIAGIHAGVVQLRDGRLLAFGRDLGGGMSQKMPRSLSADMGKTWTVSESVFPGIGGGQRLVLLRLREGPLLFVSFAPPPAKGTPRAASGFLMRDATGRERPGHGMFAALSFDEGQTWPIRRLVTAGGPAREIEWLDSHQFTLSDSSAEPRGYLAACQTPNGVVHLITSRQHYAFNLAWLSQPFVSQETSPRRLFWLSGNRTVGVCRLTQCSVLRAGVSSAGESHPHALSEPDVTLSHHPAPIIQLLRCCGSSCQ